MRSISPAWLMVACVVVLVSSHAGAAILRQGAAQFAPRAADVRVVATTPEETAGAPLAASSVHGLRLQNRTVDTSTAPAAAATLGAAQQRTRRNVVPLLVQCPGPIAPDWLAQMTKAGLRVCGYVPDDGLLIEARSGADAQALPFVRWVGEYMPGDKIAPALQHVVRCRQRVGGLAATGAAGPTRTNLPAAIAARVSGLAAMPTNHLELTVQLFSADDLTECAMLVGALGGAVQQSADVSGAGRLRIALDAARVADLARSAAVQWLEEYQPRQLLNNVAVQPRMLNVTPVWNPAGLGLSGRGQIIGHADSGLDTGNLGTMHPDFTNRILKTYAIGRPAANDWSDRNGHGTHTAGSLLGNGTALSNGFFRGVAYDAQVVHQALMDVYGQLVFPASLYNLYAPTYTDGARIHSDSWGSEANGAYDTDARDTDQYIWDHPDFLAVLAAGNAGVDANADGVIDAGGIYSPASSKNVLTVGASESDRPAGSGGYSAQPYGGGSWEPRFPVNPLHDDLVSTSADRVHQGMMANSSRGPCQDGRIKPDVVAPGTDIVSCRSRGIGAGTLWGAYNSMYVFSGGSSMATPLVAGAAALVRQYYIERYLPAITNPSAALIKATLINGARSLTPGQYGYGVAREIPSAPRPNSVEGWGQVDVAAALANMLVYDGVPLATGATNTYALTAAAPCRVSMVLAWSDYPGTLGAGQTLVNDLDLECVAPDGTTNYANGGSAPDRLNNIESIDLDAPTPGVYAVRVVGHNVPLGGSQRYALVLRTAARPKADLEIETVSRAPQSVLIGMPALVTANINTNSSGFASATLYHRVDAGIWVADAMAPVMGIDKGVACTSAIPPQAMGAQVEYYVSASASDGSSALSSTTDYTVVQGFVYVAQSGVQVAPYGTWATAFSNIPEAVDYVQNGWTVYVQTGVYGGRVGYDGLTDIIISKDIAVRGVGAAEDTVIDMRYGGRAFVLLPQGARVENFLLTRGYGEGGGGAVYMRHGVVRRCIMWENYCVGSTPGGGAAYLDGGGMVDSCDVVQNLVLGNFTGYGGGVECWAGGAVVNSRITRNQAPYGGGVFMWWNGYVSNCTVAGNVASGFAAGLGVFRTGVVHNSVIYDNSGGEEVGSYGGQTGSFTYCCLKPLLPGVGNSASDPLIGNAAAGDLHLRIGSPCIDTGTNVDWMATAADMDGNARIYNGIVDRGCYELGGLRCSFVAAPREALAPATIQFSAAVTGTNPAPVYCLWDFNNDGVIETQGWDVVTPKALYTNEGVYSMHLVVSNTAGEAATWTALDYVTVYAGSVRYVALVGGHAWPYSTWAKAATNIEAALNAATDGQLVLVSNGTYRLASTLFVSGAITLRGLNGAAATVINGAGQIALYTQHAGALVEGFTVSNGFGIQGPVIVNAGTVRNCIVRNCAGGYAGGMYVQEGATVRGCEIRNNASTSYSGGVMVHRNALVENCVVRNNHGNNCGGVYLWDGGTVRGCVLYDNVSDWYGGGVYFGGLYNSPGAWLENCTVVSNKAANMAGGVFAQSNVVVRNCIIWSNSAPVAANYTNYDGNVRFDYTCITPLVPGAGNLEIEPQLASFAARDLRLAYLSPCRNTGTNLAWMAGATDLIGTPRIFEGRADMGAYETTNTALFAVSRTRIPFSSVLINGVATQTLQLSNIGGGPCSGTISNVVAPFAANVAGFVLPATSQLTVTWTFAPTAEVLYTNFVLISSVTNISILLSGTGIPEGGALVAAGVLAVTLFRARRRANHGWNR